MLFTSASFVKPKVDDEYKGNNLISQKININRNEF